MSRRDAQPALKNAEQRGLGHFPNKHFATQKVFLYRRKHCLLALRTVKLPFQSSRVIFLGRSPAEEHLPAVIQARKCMKKKKHISEEQHYLCEIGLEKMPYGSSWLYKSYTEESLTHITITAAPCKVPALPWWIHPLGRRLVGCGSHFLSAWFYSPYL